MTSGISTPKVVKSTRPALTYVESNHKPNVIVHIMRLIIEIIKRIFGILQFWKADPHELESRQIQAFKNIQLKSFLKPQGPPPKNDYQSFREKRLVTRQNLDIIDDTPNAVTREVVPLKSEYDGKDFPPALQHMRRMMTSFVNNTIECIYETKIFPLTEHRTEHIEKASKMIKNLSAILIPIGFQLKVPIFDMLQQNQITCTNSELFDESKNKALDWLIEHTESVDLYLDVEKSLFENISTQIQQQKLEIEFDEETKRCTTAVLKWIFNTKRTPLFHDTFSKTLHPMAKVEIIYQQCLTVLIDKKLDGLCSDLNVRLIENLPSLIYDCLKANSDIIVEELSGRIADILSHVDISKFIDDLTYAFYQQTKTYLEAKVKVENECGDFISGDPSLEMEAEFIQTCANKFATLESAHPNLQEIMTIPRGKDPTTWPVSEHFKKWKESIEERFITEACQTLVDVLFPKKKCEEDGKIVEIDGLKSLWKRVIVPPELKNIMGEVEIFVQRFLPGDFTFTRDVKTMINNMTEQFIIMAAKTQLRDFLSKKLFALFKSLITPEQFSNLLVKYVAPVIEAQYIELVTRIALTNTIDSYSEIFSALRKTKNEIIKTSTEIKTCILSKLKSFTMTMDEMSESTSDHLDRLAELILDDLNNALIAAKGENLSVESIIKALTTSADGQTNPHHEIARNIIVPKIDEIHDSICEASKAMFQITKIENEFADKLYKIFYAKANEFHKNGGLISKEDFLNKVAKPMFQDFEDVLSNKDFATDEATIAIGKFLKGEVGNEEDTNIYSEMVLNLLFDIGEFGGKVTEYAVNSFSPQINQSISKTISRFKKDDYLLISMITNKIQEKFSSKEDIKKAFFSDEEITLNPLNLDSSISRISGIMYDIFLQIAAPSEGMMGMVQNFIVSPFIGLDSSSINNTIRKIYNRLFQDELINTNLVFKIKDILTRHITTAALAINLETVSYTGIQNNFTESDCEILPFSPGKPVRSQII